MRHHHRHRLVRRLRRNRRYRRCHSYGALVAPPGVCEMWPLTLKMATYKEVVCKAAPQTVKRVNMRGSSSSSSSGRRTRRASRHGGMDSNIMYSVVMGWSRAWKLEGAGTGMVRGSRLSLLTSYSRLKQVLRLPSPPRLDALYHCCFSFHCFNLGMLLCLRLVD